MASTFTVKAKMDSIQSRPMPQFHGEGAETLISATVTTMHRISVSLFAAYSEPKSIALHRPQQASSKEMPKKTTKETPNSLVHPRSCVQFAQNPMVSLANSAEGHLI